MNNSKFAGLGIEVDKPQRMPLLHPNTRQPLRAKVGTEGMAEEAFIDIYSSDSKVSREHERSIQRRRLNMRGRGRITPEEMEAEAVDLLSALTAGWSLVTLDGEKLDVPFSQENARELYSAPSLAWIREQVNEFAADRANFPQSSSKS